MKAVLISIQPKWVAKIANGEKTIEVRKTMPKLERPFKVYIYATWNGNKKEIFVKQDGRLFCENWRKASGLQRGSGKVIGEFVCDRIDDFLVFENGTVQYWNCHELEKNCLTYNELSKYIGKNKKWYGWHISDLKIYEKPKELSEFKKAELEKCEETECYSDNGVACYACWGHAGYIQKTITRPPQSWCYVEEK